MDGVYPIGEQVLFLRKGWLFGAKVVKDFNYLNKLSLICRAH
jgi:hypothetical protein